MHALSDMRTVTTFIAICFQFAWHALLIHSKAVPLAVVDDFVMKDGKLMQANFAKSLNRTWYSNMADYKLDVLKNDMILEASLDTCVEEGEDNTEDTIIEFRDIAQVFIPTFILG